MKKIELERVETGIPGLDKLIGGGIPSGTLNLLAGRAGTGKTIFSTQFLYHGAKEKNEPALYITLEEEPEAIIETASGFGWDLEELIKQKKLSIIKPALHRFGVLNQVIGDEIERIGAKRAVITPFSLITAFFGSVYGVRSALSDLRRIMKKYGCTVFVITDIQEGEQTFSSTGFEEFVADSILVLDLLAQKESGAFVRTLFIRKMDRTKHPIKLIPFEIEENGISLHPDAEVF